LSTLAKYVKEERSAVGFVLWQLLAAFLESDAKEKGYWSDGFIALIKPDSLTQHPRT
jgi:hypothetical protein